jgi:hypothetical protein
VSGDDADAVRRDFEEAVNMTPGELESWLATEKSRAAGTGVGHDMGERIVALRRTRKDDLTEADHAAMRKVVGYVRRHLAQGPPQGDVEDSPWRRSLMNWGHDPLKN